MAAVSSFIHTHAPEPMEQDVKMDEKSTGDMMVPASITASSIASLLEQPEWQQLSEDANASVADFMQVKDAFLAVHQKYVQVEASKQFLQQILAGGHCTDSDLEHAESQVADGRRALEEIRASFNDVIMSINQKAQEVAAARSKLANFRQRFMQEEKNKIDQASSQKGTLEDQEYKQQLNANTNELGKSNDDDLLMDTLGRCQNVIDNQVAMLVNMERENEALQEQIQSSTQEIPQLNARLQEVQQLITKQRQQHKASPTVLSAGSSSAHTREQVTWHTLVATLMKQITGLVSTPTMTDNVLHISLNDGLDIAVTYAPDLVRFQSAEIKGNVNAPVDDIVAQALRTQNLPFLVREVRGRISQSAQRINEIKTLCSRYLCQWDEKQDAHGKNTVSVQMENGISCVLFVGYNYPIIKDQSFVQSVDAVVGWTSKDLDDVKTVINKSWKQSQAWRLTDLVDVVKQSMDEKAKSFL